MVANFSATILVYPFTRQMCSPLSKFRYSTIVQADQKNKETPDFKGFLKKIERVMGIEPTYPAWKAGVLPLNYTRISVGVTGFEPATSWSQTRRSSQAEPHPESIVFHYTFKTSYKVQESNVFGQALDRLVTVSSMCCHTSTSALSTLSSSRGLTTFVGISHLEGGFTLRCLQRLSLPDLATLPCSWRNNRSTSGQSIPVLSY